MSCSALVGELSINYDVVNPFSLSFLSIVHNQSSAIVEMTAQCCMNRIFALDWGYLSFTHCFSVMSQNIAINSNYMAEKRIL